MSRKTRSFRELLDYISKPPEKGPLWLHNIPGDPSNSESVLQEFEANARLLRRRRNGNVLYHEILSFSSEDGDQVNQAVTESVTRHYLEMRAPYALAVARAHFNTNCPHVHVVISANDLGSPNRLRIEKKRFEEMKRLLAGFVRARFPELIRSSEPLLPPLGSGSSGSVRESNKEAERRRRGEIRPSRKQDIRDQVARALAAATSGEDCYRRLLSEGLRLYKRGSSIGVEDTQGLTARRYRLKTLGLDAEFERVLARWRVRTIPRDQDRSR